MVNELDGYLGQTQLPTNIYESEKRPGHSRGFGWGSEFAQTKTDMSMAQYNNQVHEAELLKQRQWALNDRDYNSPEQLRKRLEAAGYNPSLMSGAIQTANSPVRSASANSPTGQSTNMSGFASANNQAIGNILQAGQSLMSTALNRKQIETMDADINLKNSQSVETLTRSAKTDQDRKFASDLFDNQKNALELDLLNKSLDSDLKTQQLETAIPEQLKNLASQRTLNEAQIKQIQASTTNQTKLTNSQIQQINQSINQSAQTILNDKEKLREITQNIANGRLTQVRDTIRLEVEKTTKKANQSSPYVDIVTKIVNTIANLTH